MPQRWRMQLSNDSDAMLSPLPLVSHKIINVLYILMVAYFTAASRRLRCTARLVCICLCACDCYISNLRRPQPWFMKLDRLRLHCFLSRLSRCLDLLHNTAAVHSKHFNDRIPLHCSVFSVFFLNVCTTYRQYSTQSHWHSFFC